MNNVTVVIPVYDDWDTLKNCISSLQRYLSENDQVLLINDRGPDSDHLEEQILSVIEGYNNFRYEKNPENLGFVKTCNRAVYELDKTDNDILLLNSDTEVTEGFLEEMQEVLYITEKHGVVCPRSNCATIYTVPYLKDPSVELTPEDSYKVYTRVRDKLPRYHVMPTGVGFAMLIKRSLIKCYGLFDEIYSPGYNEENDFCMRINQYGYNAVCANRAFVYHYESKSFGSKRKELDEKNSLTLLKRYSYYRGMVELYQAYQMNPVEHFSDIIGGLYKKRKVLIDLYEVPSSYNGTAQYGLSILKSFYKLYKDEYEIHILINEAADRFHHVNEIYDRVEHPDNIIGNYDIAFIPSQIIHSEHMHLINRHCLKYIFCMQDVISLRCGYILVDDWERYCIFRDSLRYADGLIFISRFDEYDTRAYFDDVFSSRDIYTKVIYHGVEREKKEDNTLLSNEVVPFVEYIVLIGNHYKHKCLDRVIPYLQKTHFNYVIIGNSFTGSISKNIYGYQAGSLSNEYLEKIFTNCRALLFPSVYEGFGLPILTAIDHNKPIVVNENELNKELKNEFDSSGEYIHMYESMEEIERIIDKVMSEYGKEKGMVKEHIRTWDDVAYDVNEVVKKVLSDDSDISSLIRRWRQYQYESGIHRCYLPGTYRRGVFETLKAKLIKYPLLYNCLKRIKHKLKEK